MQIGYIGVGNMGGALARRLQLRHTLMVYDVSQTAVQNMTERGATSCSTVHELAAKCDVIFLCLPTSEYVRDVIFGDNGIATSAKKGTLIVDQTTGEPSATKAMAAALAQKGLELIDAPVSGGPMGADAGTIAIMVGASDVQYDRIQPILHWISPNVYHAGAVGTGHVTKLANNLLSAGQRAITHEAISLAVKNGVDPYRAVDMMMAGSGRNFFLEKFITQYILSGKLASGFTVGLLHKDVRLACKLGADSSVPLLFGNLAQEFYLMAKNELGQNTEVNAVALMVDRIMGTNVVPPNYSLE